MLHFTFLSFLVFGTQVISAPTASWQDIPCTDPSETDASIPASQRWAGVQTDAAWNDALAYWQANQGAGGLTFVEAISNFFHGPEAMQCGLIGQENKCDGSDELCNDTSHPAGIFIINSFMTISEIHNNMYNALGNSLAKIEADIGNFAATFAPVPAQSNFRNVLVDVLGLTFALLASPMWNIVLKESAFWKGSSNELGTLKDSINPLVSNGATIIKDSSVAGQVITETNDLAGNVKGMIQVWQDALSQTNEQLFNGSQQSIDMLAGLIGNGKMIEANTLISDTDAETIIEQVIYSQLIPMAWATSNNNYSPFILDTQTPCGTMDPVPQYVSNPNEANTWSCYNGDIYYLKTIGTQAEQIGCGAGDNECYVNGGFQDLPGLSNLGDGNWAGISVSDFVAGSVNTYNANGQQNLGSDAALAAVSSIVLDADLYDASTSLHVPGVINLPVCPGANAMQSWLDLPSSDKPTNPGWPCTNPWA